MASRERDEGRWEAYDGTREAGTERPFMFSPIIHFLFFSPPLHLFCMLFFFF